MSQVAILTGASKGMGKAAADELEARGYEIVTLSTSAGDVKGSVTNFADLKKLVDCAIKKYGRIDAVVNSTGHAPSNDILNLSDEEWHSGMDLVFLNVVRMARLVTPHFLKQGKGAIVNISTFATFEPDPKFPVSACMRAALASYTKLYADKYAEKNIRMNNLLAGFIESYPINDDIKNKIPMRRAGRLNEVGNTIAFLLSDDAGYITGQNIRVDGGLTRSV